MAYHPDIHHRRSIRLKDYDYSKEGTYFVTICTHERECLFGNVSDGIMVLNDAGKVAWQCWEDIPNHFPHVALDVFVIMPNHIHGVVEINGPVGARFIAPDCPDTSIKQGAMNCSPTLGTIMRGFKARCTHAINQLRNIPGVPVWQRNYYERVIRNDRELAVTREYIVNNPAQWDQDTDNPKNSRVTVGAASNSARNANRN